MRKAAEQKNMSSNLSNLSIIQPLIAENDWKAVEGYFNNSPQLSYFGISVKLDDPDAPRCEILKIMPYHLGGLGLEFINGGVISAVVDLAIGLTAIRYLNKGYLATSKLNIDLIRPIDGQCFYAISKMNRKIDAKVFSEATIFNYKDEPCVYASGATRIGINGK